jgi:hypothetical protein
LVVAGDVGNALDQCGSKSEARASPVPVGLDEESMKSIKHPSLDG